MRFIWCENEECELFVIYDTNREYEIKRDLFKNISNLILAYGKTMDNKDHGSNLLHKLLLEGILKTIIFYQ